MLMGSAWYGGLNHNERNRRMDERIDKEYNKNLFVILPLRFAGMQTGFSGLNPEMK